MRPPPLWNFSKNSSDLVAGPFPKSGKWDGELGRRLGAAHGHLSTSAVRGDI